MGVVGDANDAEHVEIDGLVVSGACRAGVK